MGLGGGSTCADPDVLGQLSLQVNSWPLVECPPGAELSCLHSHHDLCTLDQQVSTLTTSRFLIQLQKAISQ